MNPFFRCSLRYYRITSSSSYNIPYSGPNFSIILGLSSILKLYSSQYGGSQSINCFLNSLIKLQYSSGIRGRGLIYCFSSSAFLISSIITAKILQSYFLANKIKGAACIIRISTGFNILSSHSLLRLVVVALSYWFEVYSKGNLYYIKFKQSYIYLQGK